MHPVFHVSLLKKCIDPTRILSLRSVDVKDNLSYKEVPGDTLDR